MKQINPIRDTNNMFEIYSHWDGGKISLTPVYFEQDGKRHFIVNIGGNETEDLDHYVHQLSQNDGKYFCFYCHYHEPDIRKFLDTVKQKNWHFVYSTRFDVYDDWVDLGGNIEEFSCAFRYRIYDMELFEKLKQEFPKIKVKMRNQINK
jgi:hypothetical protein